MQLEQKQMPVATFSNQRFRIPYLEEASTMNQHKIDYNSVNTNNSAKCDRTWKVSCMITSPSLSCDRSHPSNKETCNASFTFFGTFNITSSPSCIKKKKKIKECKGYGILNPRFQPLENHLKFSFALFVAAALKLFQ